MAQSNYDIVNSFVTHNDFVDDLVYSTNYKCFFYWQDGWYKRLERRDLQQKIIKFVSFNAPKKSITMSVVNDIYGLVELMCVRSTDNDSKGYIAFKDKILNLKTFEWSEKNKDIIITHYLPYESSELQQATPNFDKYLKTTLVTRENNKDEDLIKFVQEMFGFFLMDSMKGAGAFFLVGQGSNGKSVMTYIIQEMVGREFCSAMSIQELTTDKFSTVNLIGKKVNVSSEEESKYMRSDKFKALVSGDLIAAEQKFGEKFQFIPTTKYVFSSNELPTFDSMNYGLKRRIKIVPFNRIFKDEDQDKELTSKLVKEMPGIIAWAIEGAKRFIKNGYVFTLPQASKEALTEFESTISSSLRFVRDNYLINDESITRNDDLYEHYKDWCVVNGKKAINKFGFLRDISQNIEGIKSTRGRDGDARTYGKNLVRIGQEKITIPTEPIPFG